MLAGFLQAIVHDRRLMRDASVNLAIRWFAGSGMAEALPDLPFAGAVHPGWRTHTARPYHRAPC